MPIYGRYEPAEAMRDLGISLAHAVTGMAQTELESRKMDLALKESDLKLGLLEKESAVNTLKAQLEGEVRKTSLAQKAEEMGMQKQRDIVAAEHGKAMEKISLGQLGVQQAELGLKQKQYEFQTKPITWAKVAEGMGPLKEYMEMALGPEMLKQETTRQVAEPVVKAIYEKHPGSIFDHALYSSKQKLDANNKRIKELYTLAQQGDEAAINELNTMIDKSEALSGSITNILNTFSMDKGNMGATVANLVKAGMTNEEAEAEAIKLHTMMSNIKKESVKSPADIQDIVIAMGRMKDPNPIDPKKQAAPFIEDIKNGKKTKEDAIKFMMGGAEKSGLRPSQVEAVIAAIEDGIASKKPKPSFPADGAVIAKGAGTMQSRAFGSIPSPVVPSDYVSGADWLNKTVGEGKEGVANRLRQEIERANKRGDTARVERLEQELKDLLK